MNTLQNITEEVAAEGEGTTATVFLFTLITFLAVKLFLNHRGSKPLPPGPWGNYFPLFGYLPFLGGPQPPYVTLSQIADKYGRIFRIKLGNKTMVLISDPKLLRDVFKRDDVTDRPHNPLNDGLMDGYGISSAEGQLWKSQRQFAHMCLRDVGFLKSSAENKARFEANASRAIDALLQELSETNGKAVDLERMLSFTVANIFFTIVISKTFDQYDPELMKELDGIQDSFKIIESINLANFIPIFCYFPQFSRVIETVLGRREATRNFFRNIIQQHRETLDVNSPRDIIDAFLIRMDKDKEENVESYFSEIQLLSVLGDLFSAGTETTKTTLRWLFLAITRQPDIQKKVRQELDDVIGRNRLPVLNDRIHLPYMEAVIQETLRTSSIVAMGNPHCPVKDVTIDGYLVPKGAMVTGLLWKFHRDPNVWPYPDEFNPENFLNIDKVKASQFLMPFSIGRRICLGEDVARNEIFLIAASMLQKFNFEPEMSMDGTEVPLPTLDQTRGGFLRSPMSYKIRAIPRFHF
uniref:Cytochrome P450 18G1 n=1 Tax=Chamberlinius hualienensis TaxID=1551368 RepID=A0A1J1E1L4_9MYRI|nr:cytochrome P450 18G1 [Chamberlinius hualienensis]